MGRRAVRRVNPNLDLSTHLKTLKEIPPELLIPTLFSEETAPSGAPLEVEVGSGKGLFLYNAALMFPERRFVGLELAAKYARFAASRLARHSLANARVIHGDALAFFQNWVAPASLAAVHVYFPDPWWKARHKKRRVMTPQFLKNVSQSLMDFGRLHFWTDVEEYFHESLAVIAANPHFSPPLPVPERESQHDLDYRTHFERRMRLAGEPVYRAEFLKVADSAASTPILPNADASPSD